MFCRIARWNLSSTLDSEKQPWRATSAHLDRCAECAAYRDKLDRLDELLQRGAPGAAAPLHSPRRSRAWIPLALAGATAALALAFFATGDSDSEETPRHQAHSEDVTPAAPTPPPPERETPESAPRKVTTRLVARLAEQNPLERELDALVSDSRRGLEVALEVGGLSLDLGAEAADE
jgi:hypothetical protein